MRSILNNIQLLHFDRPSIIVMPIQTVNVNIDTARVLSWIMNEISQEDDRNRHTVGDVSENKTRLGDFG